MTDETPLERLRTWLDNNAVKVIAVVVVAILIGVLFYVAQKPEPKSYALKSITIETIPTSTTTTSTTTTTRPATTTTQPRPATTLPPTTSTLPPAIVPPPTTRPIVVQSSGDIWEALRNCESGGDYSTNTGNGYYGAYQFSEATWNSMGTGYPFAHVAPPDVQDDAARRLQERSGWGQWPACSKKIGVR